MEFTILGAMNWGGLNWGGLIAGVQLCDNSTMRLSDSHSIEEFIVKKSRQGDRKRAVAALAPRARPIEARNRFDGLQNTDDDDDDDDDARKIGTTIGAPPRGTTRSDAPLRSSGSATWKRKPLGSLGKVCPRDGGSNLEADIDEM